MDAGVARLEAYLAGPFDSVHGWCHRDVFQFIAAAHLHQVQTGVHGGVIEIGVHVGKFFIGLHSILRDDEKSLAIDVFESQELNIDKSGFGSRDQFERNLAAHAHRPQAVEIMKGDSMGLTTAEIVPIRNRLGPVRFFSVDGGHTAEHTIKDFQTAMELTSSAGIIIIDDYYNPHWPGVHEGMVRFLTSHAPPFVPLAYGFNKLFLANISHHRAYLFALGAYFKKLNRFQLKAVKMVGYDTLVVT